MFPREISKRLYDKYLLPLKKHKPLVFFPDIFEVNIADPLRVSLLKLIKNNDHVDVITPKDLGGHDISQEYHDSLGFEYRTYEHSRVCYLLVDDKVVLVDYSEKSNYMNGPLRRAWKKTNRHDIVHAMIKFQCGDDGDYKSCPVPVYPFLYPGPNDFESLPKERRGGQNVFSGVTYFPSYHETFVDNCHHNRFDFSVFARWGCPSTSLYGHRRTYNKLSEQIPRSSVVSHSNSKSVSVEEYFRLMCKSKFAIAIRGSGKFSHREMEICSVGLPMFTEDRNQRMWRPFLANEHYIPITPETFIDVFNYYDEHYDEALEIGRNGYDYFIQNHGQAGLQVIFKEIVDKIVNL